MVPGMALRYKLSGTYYYGICTAITATRLTIAGAPLTTVDGDLTELAYSPSSDATETLIFSVNGAFADAAETAMLKNDMLLQFVWPKRTAYCVYYRIICGVDDTGASQPRVNVRLGSTTTDFVSTSNSNAGLAASDAAWAQTVVDISTAKYTVNFGDTVELKADANGTNDDARDLTIVAVFVFPDVTSLNELTQMIRVPIAETSVANYPAGLNPDVVSRGTASGNVTVTALAFDDTTSQTMTFTVPMPEQMYTSGNATLTLITLPGTTPGGATNAVFNVDTVATNGETLAGTIKSKSVTISNSATADMITKTNTVQSLSLWDWSPGDTVVFHVGRQPAHASDALVGDVQVIGASLEVPVRR
jgi:hypothetical protein